MQKLTKHYNRVVKSYCNKKGRGIVSPTVWHIPKGGPIALLERIRAPTRPGNVTNQQQSSHIKRLLRWYIKPSVYGDCGTANAREFIGEDLPIGNPNGSFTSPQFNRNP